jgi:hypothetical protein
MTSFTLGLPCFHERPALGGSVSLTGMTQIGTKEAQRTAMRDEQYDAVAEFEAKRWAALAALALPPAKKATRARFDRNAYQREYMRKRRARQKKEHAP